MIFFATKTPQVVILSLSKDVIPAFMVRHSCTHGLSSQRRQKPMLFSLLPKSHKEHKELRCNIIVIPAQAGVEDLCVCRTHAVFLID
jgi:hypothetical protein